MLVNEAVPIPADQIDPDARKVIRRLVQHDIGILAVTPERRTLEQVVLSVTGPGSDRVGP